MADISSAIKESPSNQNFQNPILTRTYQWDPVNGSGAGGTSTETVATHNIVAVPSGEAFLRGFFVVTEAFTSGGSATVKFLTGETDFTGAVAVAALTIGEVFELSPQVDQTATTGVGHYVDGATVTAETIDVTIGTAALTAGKGYFVLEFLKVGDIQAAVDG